MSALLGGIYPLSLQRLLYLGGNFFREVGGAGIGEMHIRGELDFGEAGLSMAVEVVDRNTGLSHDGGGGRIELHGLVGDTIGGALGHRSGVAPDELGSGRLQGGHDLGEIFFVIGQRDLMVRTGNFGINAAFPVGSHVDEVVEAEVEMDDVPLRITKPFPETGNAIAAGPPLAGMRWTLALPLSNSLTCKV